MQFLRAKSSSESPSEENTRLPLYASIILLKVGIQVILSYRLVVTAKSWIPLVKLSTKWVGKEKAKLILLILWVGNFITSNLKHEEPASFVHLDLWLEGNCTASSS